ncbi:hypothetical protein GH714_003587 [Hevea brasiliensis]|uniref:Uncharacterized protein n=1 Tax=Hevea brasiliensis TaxID=3981 RepID=A0A6A6L9M4_HEVBR|nr:hypothetical protein GH714_003587 [Hevea brasiliensis]
MVKASSLPCQFIWCYFFYCLNSYGTLKVANSTDEKGEAIVIPESLEGDVRGHSFKDCEAFSNDGVEDICVDSMPYGDWTIKPEVSQPLFNQKMMASSGLNSDSGSIEMATLQKENPSMAVIPGTDLVTTSDSDLSRLKLQDTNCGTLRDRAVNVVPQSLDNSIVHVNPLAM